MGRKTQYYGDKDYLLSFGRRYRQIRNHFGLTQAAFGKKLDVTAARICQIEKGDYPIGILLFNSTCREFNVDANWLLGIKKTKKKKEKTA